MTFIVGMGRSGTTMLTNMLNLNKKVIACPENEFILLSKSSFENADFGDEKVVNDFINLFEYKLSKIISFWKPKPELKEIIKNMENKSFSNVCKQVYLNYPFAKNNPEEITCIIDKNPIYSLYIDELYELYPDAKFIILTRDYRDNIVSRKKFSDKKSSIYILAASWNYFYKSIFKSIHKNKINHIIVRYEDLVNNPSDTLNKLCNFLTIDFDEKMLQFQDLSKEIKNYIKENLTSGEFDKLISMHHNLEKKINVDRVDSYKKELPENEITILDYTCAKYGKEFNYEPNGNSKVNLYNKLRLLMSNIKITVYYFYHAMNYKIPLGFKLFFATKKHN